MIVYLSRICQDDISDVMLLHIEIKHNMLISCLLLNNRNYHV